MPLSKKKPRAAAGRKPDPTIDQRVSDAALQLYGDKGWAGFNLDSIARLAGVGKAALYRRWRSREALLTATLLQRWDQIAEVDEGSLDADLRRLVEIVMQRLLSSQGRLVMTLQADSLRYLEVREIAATLSRTTMDRMAAILTRSVTRGELPPETDLALVSHLITGAVSARISRSVEGSAPLNDASARDYMDRLIAFLLAGLRARP